MHPDNNTRVISAESAQYLGLTSTRVPYVSWAIGYAMSLGFNPRQLLAQAQVDFLLLDEQSPPGPEATGSHLRNPLEVMKGVLDGLGVTDGS